MQVSAITKALLIAIPVLVLSACGATSDDQDGTSQTTNAVTDSANEAANGAANDVQTGVAAVEKSAEELQEEKFEELRQAQTLYFDYDKSKVDAKYLELLQAHADFLVKSPSTKVMIEGHCDERGTPEYNIALGERRAKAVAQYLQSLGVMASQITTVSYGEEKPIDLSRTTEGFSKNRRAVLVY